MERRYPTDLTDEQGSLLEPLLPPAKRGGRPRTVDLRLVLDTIFYRNRSASLPRSQLFGRGPRMLTSWRGSVQAVAG